MENMEHEKKFVDLLGFSIVSVDNNNYYKILDDTNREVGFIERKMIHRSINGVTGKQLPAIFGYHMKIDTNSIHYDATREFYDRLDKSFDIYDQSFYYEFSAYNKEDRYQVKLSLGEKPRLLVKNNDGVWIDFSLDKEKLYISLKSKTDKFNVLETILTKANTCDKNIYKGLEYIYNITYCDKNQSLNQRIGRKTEEYHVKRIKNDSYQDKVNIKVNNWKDGQVI